MCVSLCSSQVRKMSPSPAPKPGLKTPTHPPHCARARTHRHTRAHTHTHVHARTHTLQPLYLSVCIIFLPNCKLPAGRKQENILSRVPWEAPSSSCHSRKADQTRLSCWGETRSSPGISSSPQRGQKCPGERMSLCLRHSFQASPERERENSINKKG